MAAPFGRPTMPDDLDDIDLDDFLTESEIEDSYTLSFEDDDTTMEDDD
jgi:hypothetical protein